MNPKARPGWMPTLNQAQIDALYEAFCRDWGIVMDSDEDRWDYGRKGHLYDDPGSDVNDAACA